MSFDINTLLRSSKDKNLGELYSYHARCCVKGGCGSSDGMAIYRHGDKWQFYCFACGETQQKGITDDLVHDIESESTSLVKSDFKTVLRGKESRIMNPKEVSQQVMPESFAKGKIRELTDRGISESVAKKFGVRTRVKKDSEDIAQHIYPYYDERGSLVAQHIRQVEDKDFFWQSLEKGFLTKIQLFGQHLFAAGQSRKITITEGECDAMAAFQMNGELYPVVSVPSGAESVKKVFKNDSVYKFLDSFPEIIISMDNDDAGKKAAKEIAEIFPKKSKIMQMRYKDANDYLRAGKTEDWVRDVHNAQSYSPEGLVKSSALIKPLLCQL